MTQNFRSHLIRVNPMQITVQEALLQPTWWDNRAVEDDLVKYVSLTRLIPGTPTLHISEGKLVIINGLPFLHAAQQAKPSLDEIICRVDTDDKTFRYFDLKEVKASELLDRYPANEVYKAVEMVAFTRSLDQNEQELVEKSISGFFREMKENPTYGGEYRSIEGFRWEDENTRVIWRWERCAEEGKHTVYLVETLKEIDTKITFIKSWNGLAFTFREHYILEKR